MAYDEYELSHTSPFSRVVLRDEPRYSGRKSFELPTLRKIQAECRDIDDPNRWLIALLSDSGLRLGEAVGLVAEDINLDAYYPYLSLWRGLGDG